MLWIAELPGMVFGRGGIAPWTKGGQITAGTGEHPGTNGGFPLMSEE
jgi:hypothetical protein